MKDINRLINLAWYNERYEYSDGWIESEILRRLSSGETEQDLLARDNRWPVIYHFSPQRWNIVKWLPIQNTADVLEVGSGMGAITRALCEKARSVTCVELSLIRSKINATRNREHDNLEIIVANFHDLPVDRRFDLVTLIGVLEYSGKYTETSNPYADLIKQACAFVRPGGQLVIAIENRYGLKYFAGANEDHYGIPYFGINGYPETSEIRTFSYSELIQLLKEANCLEYDLYFPFPDYKFPTAIVSERADSLFSQVISEEKNYGGYSMSTFNQRSVFASFVKQGIFKEFANSFLVVVNC